MRSIPIPPELMNPAEFDFEEDFSNLLHTCKVPEPVCQILSEKQFTSVALFAFAFVDEGALENFIQHVGTLQDDPPEWLTSVSASSIRHLHHCCKKSIATDNQPSSTSDAQPVSTIGQSANLLELAWADLPPIRVKEGDFLAMKKDFSVKYPSESLSSMNTPCARLIATLMQ